MRSELLLRDLPDALDHVVDRRLGVDAVGKDLPDFVILLRRRM